MKLEALSVVDLADLLLLFMVRRGASALTITPSTEGHRVSLGLSGEAEDFILPAALGDAVIVRLCLVGGLDLLASSAAFGRFRLLLEGNPREEAFALGIRNTPLGLSAELFRLATEGRMGADGADYDAYELKQELGRGGLGSVYLAKHKPLGRMVAIKVLHPHIAKDSTNAERFIREARAAGRVRHPCVVEIFDFGYTPDGRPFLVMELVDGKTLRAQLETPLSPAKALEVARQIASALAVVHGAGVIHRDLKPENIFVSDHDWVKIVDFGAAKGFGESDLPELTQEGIIFGTPLYMSPEHIQGARVDHRTDLYALGCVLFEMLTGKPPYKGKNPMEIFYAHCNAPIPEATNPEEPLPSLLNEIIEKCLEKHPEDRYQSAGELLLVLERAKFAVSRKGWRRWLPL